MTPTPVLETVEHAESDQISKMRLGAIALCRLFRQDPELVRAIEFRQNYIVFEVYVLDDKGAKTVEFGKPVTRRLRFVSS